MIGMDWFSGIVLIVSVVIVLVAIVVALRDGERVWSLGMAIATALVAPLGVVLAIVYVTSVRKARNTV